MAEIADLKQTYGKASVMYIHVFLHNDPVFLRRYSCLDLHFEIT